MLRGFGGDVVYVFAVHVRGVANECAAAIASSGVTLFETKDLDFGLNEVEELHVCDLGNSIC